MFMNRTLSSTSKSKALAAGLLAALTLSAAACGTGFRSDLAASDAPVSVAIDTDADQASGAPSVAPAVSSTPSTTAPSAPAPADDDAAPEAPEAPKPTDPVPAPQTPDVPEKTPVAPVGPEQPRPPMTTVNSLTVATIDPGPLLPTGPTDLANPTVPGEPLDYGPEIGRPLTVVGVQYDDSLNFRIAPSPNATVVDTIPALAPEIDIYSLGEAWAAPSGVWWKVNVMGQEAWANQKYLAIRGGSAPIFDEVAAELQILMFEDLEDVALEVAATRASVEPESRVVLAQAPYMWDLTSATIVVDVLDLGDIDLKGERLYIDVEVVFDEASGEPGAQDIAFVVLNGVEMTALWAH